MNKKKGSAMVLAILLLAFFMALSLNMWFISQKKAQRAGDKVIGNKVLTDIDGSSTLGYYEFYLATEYMAKGFVTSSSAVGGYVLPTSTTNYGVGGVPTTTAIEGIYLDNEKQYFGSYLLSSGAFTTSANAILNRDEIVSGKLNSRDWTVTGGAILSELWNSSNWGTQESFGGYKIDAVTVGGFGVTTSTDFLYRLGVTTKTAITLYRKTIYFPSTEAKLQPIAYGIIVERESVIKISGSAFEFSSDNINSITVTKQ